MPWRRVLIVGGTFDPPHLAHTELPPLVAQQRGCQRLLYVPTSQNPLKDEAPTAPAHRLAMLRAAIDDVDGATISTFELDRSGPSYTVDLLEALRGEHGEDVELHMMLGADAALDFHRWRRPERVLELATPAIVLRPPWDAAHWRARLIETMPAADVERWLEWTVDVPALEISATEIRERLVAGRDVSDLLPEGVVRYIEAHGLYGAGESDGATKRRSDEG